MLQTLRSWVATSHHRPLMAIISHNSFDTPGFAPLMNILFCGRCDSPISFSGRDVLKNVWNRLKGSSMVGTEFSRNNIGPLSRMLYDIMYYILYSDTLHWWDITPIFDPLLIWTLLPNLTFYLIVWSYHRIFATGAACQQRTLTPHDTWFCPTFGLACVLISRQVSPELVLFPDFEFRTSLGTENIPRQLET